MDWTYAQFRTIYQFGYKFSSPVIPVQGVETMHSPHKFFESLKDVFGSNKASIQSHTPEAGRTKSASELFDYTLRQLGGSFATSRIPQAISSLAEYDRELALHICETLYRIRNYDIQAYTSTIRNLIYMSEEFLELQSELERLGHYRYSSFDEVKKSVIDNPTIMEGRYLDALFLSQSFWPNHNRILSFFIENFCRNLKPAGSMLEVPCGSGVFSLEFLMRNRWEATLCDLSEYSVAFSKTILESCGIEKAQFVYRNVFDLDENVRFDRIICGELLEHLENPQALLDKLHRLLKDDGMIFLTTAVWAAAIDHIYLFEDVKSVDEMIEKRFKFVKKLVLPLNPAADPNQSRIPINYAAILIK